MNRKHVRVLFLAVLAILPLQYAAVGIVGELAGEPWPAVVMPGFQDVWDQKAAVAVQHAHFEVVAADGSRIGESSESILRPLPRSYHPAVLRLHFQPESISGDKRTERATDPGARQWLKKRLQELEPDVEAVRVDVVWHELRYERERALLSAVPLDTLVLELH